MVQQTMVTDPRFDKPADREDEYEQQRRDKVDLPPPRSAWKGCLIGCLVVLGVLLVFAVVIGIWVGKNWRGWFADFGSEAVKQGIKSSDLPPQEKVEVMEQVERVAKAIRDGRISMEQAVTIGEKLMESPLMPSLVVVAVEKQYFDESGLSDDEKAEGRKALRRFARGMVDKKIDQQGVDAVLSHVADRKADNSWEPRSKVSDAELRAALKEAKERADAAGIPEEPEEFDPSDEVRRIIDESLQKR